MTTLHVDLPDDLAAKLRARAGNASVEEYVRELVREYVGLLDSGAPQAILDEDDPNFEAELEKRLDDPRPEIEATPQFWSDLKRRVHEKHAAARRQS